MGQRAAGVAMVLAVLWTVRAAACEGVALPAGEEASAWRGPLRLAGLCLAEEGAPVRVSVEAGADTWTLRVPGEGRATEVSPPADEGEREDLAWLAASLLRSPRLSLPQPLAPPAPRAVLVEEPEVAVADGVEVEAPEVEVEPSARPEVEVELESVVEVENEVEVAPEVAPEVEPSARPEVAVAVAPVVEPSARPEVAPEVEIEAALTIEPLLLAGPLAVLRPSLGLHAGVSLQAGLGQGWWRAGLELCLHPSTSLEDVGSGRELRELDLRALLRAHRGDVTAGLGLGGSSRRYLEDGTQVDSGLVPQAAAHLGWLPTWRSVRLGPEVRLVVDLRPTAIYVDDVERLHPGVASVHLALLAGTW